MDEQTHYRYYDIKQNACLDMIQYMKELGMMGQMFKGIIFTIVIALLSSLLIIAMATSLPSIPAKRYFTIGEVAQLCAVKPHVLRYWEQEFTQLRPMKRGGNRRYYQHHEVLVIRRIRELLYEQGFTISGARSRLEELMQVQRQSTHLPPASSLAMAGALNQPQVQALREELLEIRAILS